MSSLSTSIHSQVNSSKENITVKTDALFALIKGQNQNLGVLNVAEIDKLLFFQTRKEFGSLDTVAVVSVTLLERDDKDVVKFLPFLVSYNSIFGRINGVEDSIDLHVRHKSVSKNLVELVSWVSSIVSSPILR